MKPVDLPDFEPGSLPANATLLRVHPDFAREVQRYHPVRSAIAIGQLLLRPEFQSNCLRIEALTHILLSCGNGTQVPDSNTIADWFDVITGGYLGRMEDPSEDVFVGSVFYGRNCRILEGVWTGATFYLQRFLDLPSVTGTYALASRPALQGLLRISEEVIGRAGQPAHVVGAAYPHSKFPRDLLRLANPDSNILTFSPNDLNELGIRIEDLQNFIFDLEKRSELHLQHPGNTDLERRPLIWDGSELHLALPTAVSVAIRRSVIEAATASNQLVETAEALGRTYEQILRQTPFVGGSPNAPIQFTKAGSDLSYAAVVQQVDAGTYFNFVFVLDDFENLGIENFNSIGDAAGRDLSAFGALISQLHRSAEGTPGYRSRRTLLILCGWGRRLLVPVVESSEFSAIEVLDIYDFWTLSWVNQMSPLKLWRILDGRDALAAAYVELQNTNGLLNLVAWSSHLKGHLVPHAQLPKEFDGKAPTFISIVQNGLRDVREDVARRWNVHRVVDPDGQISSVRREAAENEPTDDLPPTYVSETGLSEGRLQTLFEGYRHDWWFALTDAGSNREMSFRIWQMLCVWLRRLAPVLEDADLHIMPKAVSIGFSFAGLREGLPKPSDVPTEAQLRAFITVASDKKTGRSSVVIAEGFQDGFSAPTNIAERALAGRVIDSIADLASETVTEKERLALLDKVVPDSQARHMHGFEVRTFRDHLHASIPETPVRLNEEDNAFLRFGLGWIAGYRGSQEINEKRECIKALNSLVRMLEDRLCYELRQFDRRDLIFRATLNHEAVAADDARWARSSAALLALAESASAKRNEIARHEFANNAVSHATRVLVEAALCESPLSGGKRVRTLDLTRLMSEVMLVSHLGGWSDAMYWDAMRPRMVITPLGDVLVDPSFMEEVFEPFGMVGVDAKISDAVENYYKNYESIVETESVSGHFDDRFLRAWQAEYGATLDETRLFVDCIEDAGIKQDKPILLGKMSNLWNLESDGRHPSREVVDALTSRWTLTPRPHWREIPTGYVDADRQPWRFRRRLSVLRRPILQLDQAKDPIIVIAPGLVRDAFVYMVRNFHSGEFPEHQAGSTEMRSWIGRANHRHRSAFNAEVGKRMEELGWTTKVEIKPTAVLGRRLERDFGDIDVLAWRKDSGRVLIIECKDLHFRKTHGEIAEQLADFRGFAVDGKPDLLRKHLDRVDLLSANKSQVEKYLGLKDARIEGHLVFKNPVPMQFASGRIREATTLSLFRDLAKL
jgi:hypothetical protein